jgi:hypothetical protein
MAAVTEPRRRKRGPQPKDPATRRSEVIRVCLTPKEADVLYRLSIRRDQPLSILVRAILKPIIRSETG